MKKKIEAAQARFKKLFADNISSGMSPQASAEAARKQLQREYRGVAEWIAIITALMPLIQQLIAIFSK